MNGLVAIQAALQEGEAEHAIQVDADIRERALIPLQRMLDFGARLQAAAKR